MAQKRISEEFLDGIYEAFSVLMTNNVYLKLLNKEESKPNVYQEIKTKHYQDPIQLVGKFTLSSDQGEQDVEGKQSYVTVTVPTKSLIERGVNITPDNYKTLEDGVINYEGVDYEIKQVVPRTNIDNIFQFYVFYCEKPKVRR